MARIAFVTYAASPEITTDDRTVARKLALLGHEVVAVVWSDATVRWTAYDAVIVRSAWDYHRSPSAFRAWIDERAKDGTQLWNPPALLRWNMDKRYLLELQRQGVRIPRTHLIERGSRAHLSELIRDNGFTCAVIKPAVSADGHGTWTTTSPVTRAAQAELERAARRSALLVQEYMESVEREGEWSLVFIDGAFSHAVRKQPARGEFRVQSRYGGSAARATPPQQFVVAASEVLGRVDQPWLYARVDGCAGEDGAFVLMELEMLEPSLYLELEPEAPRRFAEAVVRRLTA